MVCLQKYLFSEKYKRCCLPGLNRSCQRLAGEACREARQCLWQVLLLSEEEIEEALQEWKPAESARAWERKDRSRGAGCLCSAKKAQKTAKSRRNSEKLCEERTGMACEDRVSEEERPHSQQGKEQHVCTLSGQQACHRRKRRLFRACEQRLTGSLRMQHTIADMCARERAQSC